MRRITKILVAAVLICSMLVIPAFAENATVTATDVNFRSGPGTGYEVIDCLAKGTSVTVTDRSNPSWYAVSYGGYTGYMSSMYLNVTEDSSTTVTAAEGSGCINAMYVRFRSGPSTDYSIIGTYNSGKALTITGTAGDWTAVVIDGTAGYVFSQYVTRYAEASFEQPSADPVVEPEPPAAPAEVTGTVGYITGDDVRFRTGPGTGYSIIASYNRGKTLTVTGLADGWCSVVIDGTAGYVYSQYVMEGTYPPAPAEPAPAPAEPAQPTVSDAGYINGNNVRFRASASMAGDIITELFYGNAVTITGYSGEWTSVVCNGQSGYVYSSYVTAGEAPSSHPSASGEGSALGQEIANFALQYVGYNYCWGGSSPATGFDCSGLVYYVYGTYGYSLNRVAADQALNGVHVDPSNLQPGDVLCFYSGSSYIGHAGIYIGDNKFVHAANSSTGVIVSELSGYYDTRGYEARRIV